MSITIKELRQFIRTCINEEQNVDHEEVGDSLDSQVDRYLSSYENSAKTVKKESSYRRGRRLIEKKDEDTGDDVPTAPSKLTTQDLDVEAFADDVARLIDNYDNLLEVKKTLIKRAINFISKTYDGDVVSAFKRAMQNNHSSSADKSGFEHEDSDFAAPRADFAGPLGG